MLAQIISLIVDVGLGALAYRLAKSHSAKLADLERRIVALEEKLR
jgi:uncharacterized membrane-anchored protein YhcB (DUF1043 family)